MNDYFESNSSINKSTDTEKYIPAEGGFDFLKVFYEILFRPDIAAKKIRILKEYYPLRLLLYSIFILGLSSLALCVKEKNLATCIQNIVVWFSIVLSIWLVAFIFRKNNKETTEQNDNPNIFSMLFFYSALAQAPTIFFSCFSLFSHISTNNLGLNILFIILKVLFFTFLFCWQARMWMWSLHNSLQISYWKSFFILILPISFLCIWSISLIFAGLFQLFL